MQGTSFTINAILEKTENRDKDFRYMATSDLLAELNKESFKPDTDSERRICRSLLKLINDQSSDVQASAAQRRAAACCLLPAACCLPAALPAGGGLRARRACEPGLPAWACAPAACPARAAAAAALRLRRAPSVSAARPPSSLAAATSLRLSFRRASR